MAKKVVADFWWKVVGVSEAPSSYRIDAVRRGVYGPRVLTVDDYRSMAQEGSDDWYEYWSKSYREIKAYEFLSYEQLYEGFCDAKLKLEELGGAFFDTLIKKGEWEAFSKKWCVKISDDLYPSIKQLKAFRLGKINRDDLSYEALAELLWEEFSLNGKVNNASEKEMAAVLKMSSRKPELNNLLREYAMHFTYSERLLEVLANNVERFDSVIKIILNQHGPHKSFYARINDPKMAKLLQDWADVQFVKKIACDLEAIAADNDKELLSITNVFKRYLQKTLELSPEAQMWMNADQCKVFCSVATLKWDQTAFCEKMMSSDPKMHEAIESVVKASCAATLRLHPKPFDKAVKACVLASPVWMERMAKWPRE